MRTSDISLLDAKSVSSMFPTFDHLGAAKHRNIVVRPHSICYAMSFSSRLESEPFSALTTVCLPNGNLARPALDVGKRLLCLSTWPYLYSRNGIGIIGNERNAKTLPAQCGPRLRYICVVNRGKTAPRMYRSIPFAARAQRCQLTDLCMRFSRVLPDAAAPLWYTSTRYVIVDKNKVKAPNPKGIPAATRAAQWPPLCGSQAYLHPLDIAV
jgi:hypothetical protein